MTFRNGVSCETLEPGLRYRLGYRFRDHDEFDEAFLVFCQPTSDDEAGDEALTSGYLLRDGSLRRLVSATRRNERNAATGLISALTVDATDSDGRTVHITGEARSQMMLARGALCLTTFLEFSLDGRTGYGEDQDVWSVARFAAYRRQIAIRRTGK